MKNTKIVIITLLLLLSFSTMACASGPSKTIAREITNVKITLEGELLNIPKSYGYPFIDNQSRTMIPLRVVSESLGHKVEWDGGTRTAIIDGSIYVTINEKIIRVPDGEIEMDTVAILKDSGTSAGSRTYVPLRFVVEALGYDVTYNGPSASNKYHHTVDIYKEGGAIDVGEVEENDGVYKIITDGGIIYFDPEKDLRTAGVTTVTDEKSYEVYQAIHDTMIYEEHDKHISFEFFLPDLPPRVSHGTTIEVVTKMGNYLGIYGTSSKQTFVTSNVREEGGRRIKVEYEPNFFDIKDIRSIYVISRLYYDNLDGYNPRTSSKYMSDLKTGRSSRGLESLYTEEELKRIEELHLPQYKH